MQEKDYWISKFDDKFNYLKGKPIALYGVGVNAREIINRFSNYEIVCLVDDKQAGKYVAGRYVVTLEEFIELGIEYLIIAARIPSAQVVFHRIGAECKANQIRVYNLYGKDMFELHADTLKKKVEYPRLKETDLLRTIDEHEIIAFDVDDTLFVSKKMKVFDFYQEIEAQLLSEGINIYYFANKAWEYKSGNPGSTFQQLLEEIVKTEGMKADILENIWEIVYQQLKKNFVPRKAVLNALKYAIEKGKKVGVVEDATDYRMPATIWKRLLSEYGVEKLNFALCSSEIHKDKYIGLVREMKDKYKNSTYLYIGDALEADILVQELYDIDTFWVECPGELFRKLESLKLETIENKSIREAYQNYLLKVYTDNYLVAEVQEKRKNAASLLKWLENKNYFYKNCEGKIYDETEIYTPVLFDDVKISADINSYEKLQFPIQEKPQVSIVIPVYNQFGYTYNCLKSILEYSGNVSYEVIIADDCSTDQVKELEKVVSGITVLHNKENLKFLLNCNHAAEYAKGEYILFLNNDTQVQPDWLKPMVELLEAHPEAGMTGAKLVYPYGCLQEAGGILWKDGSAWNYGHMKNPTEPDFCYVKEADYISGAAIMIRTSLWKEIGGFDTAFAPAYYEDTDLAFEVRKHGYKVLLQPTSVVVHFEGVSNGTDTSAGLKNYQVVNQKKFFEKWKEMLQAEHFDNGINVYLAKDRGQTKKQILVVDHYVPNFDQDAGGRCTYMYMKAFLKLGMKVTFIGDNFAKPEPYTTALNQLGIEVLYGDYYCMHWQEWLKDNLKYFDYIYLQRPHISIKYMDLVKEYGRGKIFYFAHDLHHVRMYRDYLVSGNEEALKESEHWKKIEMELFEKTDVGHVVGSYEQEIMQKAFPEKPIRNIPLYIYDDVPERIEKDFSKRKDILFVGGFKHAPNVDAVLWFGKEIFPRILEKYPDMVWHIVGSSAPDEVKALANEHIILEGFVSDEELGELYRKCRLVVVPLRYGAGVKGKIVESAYYQIPVVTTAIGGEGLDATVGSFVMEDAAEKMAVLVESLYTDYEELRKMSDAGRTMIQKYFTSKAAEQVLLADMDV